MVKHGEIHIWRGAACFRLPALLETALGRSPKFAVAESGKPYLPDTPHIRFNIARTSGMTVIAVALDVEVGVDIERLRPIPEWRDIAQRHFPEANVADEREFFRHWTRFEAQANAHGTGLLAPPRPCPTVEDLDFGPEYAAAVAAAAPRMSVTIH